MKLAFLFLSILLLSLVSAGGEDVVPCQQPGFENCQEATNTAGSATSHVRLYWSLEDEGTNVFHPGFAVGRLFLNVGFEGDGLFKYTNIGDFEICTADGCPQGDIPNMQPGEHTLANVGEEYTECPMLVAWDRAESNGWFSWTAIQDGYLGFSNCLDLKVVECFDSLDCSGNEICDKSGNWQDWSCITPECQPGQEQCSGTTHLVCDNFNWRSEGPVIGKCNVECTEIGRITCDGINKVRCMPNFRLQNLGPAIECGAQECQLGEKKCSNFNSFECNENGNWIDKGTVNGLCDVQCNLDSDCVGGTCGVGVPECTTNSDCLSSVSCIGRESSCACANGRCLSVSLEGTKPKPHFNEGAFSCVQGGCSSNSDCQEGWQCVEDECVPRFCTSVLTPYWEFIDNECIEKQHGNSCIPEGTFRTLALCQEERIPEECTTDSDCSNEETCENNVCTPKEAFDFTIVGIVLIGGLVVFSVFKFNLLGKRRR